MKKMISVLVIAIILCCSIPGYALASVINLQEAVSDTEQKSWVKRVKSEGNKTGARKYSTLELTELGYVFGYCLAMEEMGAVPSIEKLPSEIDSISTYMLSDFASITFQFEGSDISGAVLLCSGDGSIASGADIMLNMIVSIMLFDPSLSDPEIAMDALLQMINKGSYVTEYCQYEYMQNEMFGTFLTITP